jgi:A/G-specific adenine glycosylase
MDTHAFFREKLLTWFAQNHRPMPWKAENDPYRIWLSEIILQQTRVEQGMPYYLNFIERFPDVTQLANAPEDEVLKAWEGLGYYSRARNLHETAKFISGELKGVFPDSYTAIRALKGVGDYTAAAIASFAFGLPHAVLDGNVYRVLSRFWGIETPTDTPKAKKEFAALAQQLLPSERPGDFNQAIMDLGATVCTPRLPQCTSCLLHPECCAFRLNKTGELPIKSKNPIKKDRFFLYLVVNYRQQTLVQKRESKDIWRNLYEFPLFEATSLPADNHEVLQCLSGHFFDGQLPPGAEFGAISKPYRQTLTHRRITAIFGEVNFSSETPESLFSDHPFEHSKLVSKAELKKNIAVPRVIDWYLQEKALTLRLI